jgi:hypothetical protein
MSHAANTRFAKFIRAAGLHGGGGCDWGGELNSARLSIRIDCG